MEKKEWMLPYLEMHVTDLCNLNCNGCSHFSPMVRKKKNHLEIFQRDIWQIKKFYGKINTLRLLGGEPFLEKNLDQYVRVSRKVYPNSQLEIVTNGLLLPSVSGHIFQAIRDCDGIVGVSLYPPTKEVICQIEECLKKWNVNYYISPLISSFRRRLCPEGENDMVSAFQTCKVGRNCTFLYDGELSLCSGPLLIHYYNEYFNRTIQCKDSTINLYQENLTTEMIEDFLNSPHDGCRYCGPVCEDPWSKCEDLARIEESHWLSDQALL